MLKIFLFGMKVPQNIIKTQSKKGSARFGSLITLVRDTQDTAYIRPYLVLIGIIVIRNLRGLESLKQLKGLKFFQRKKDITIKFIDCEELHFEGIIESSIL